MTKVAQAAALLAIGSAMLTGCADPSIRSGAAAASGASRTSTSVLASSVADLPVATYVGSITQAISYPGEGIALSVPPLSQSPTTSWTAAYANCVTGDAVCQVGATPVISLALATTKNAGYNQPDGSTKPMLDNTLVYVMKWSNEPCVPKGGPPGRPAQPVVSCTVLNFVDAHSSKAILAVEGPHL